MKPIAALAIFAAASSIALVPAVSATNSKAGWTFERTEEGTAVAMSPRTEPKGIRLAVFCKGPKPSLVALIDGETAPRLNLAIMTQEGEASAELELQPSRRSFGGLVTAAVPELLTGSAGTALIAVREGQYFNLSLVGAREIVTKALASCWTRPAQPTIKPAPPIKGAVGPLGIAPGHYVSSLAACKDTYEVFFYDGKRAGMVDPEGKFPVRPVGNVIRNADGSLYLSAQEIELRKLSGGQISLSIQDISPPMRICPAAELPREWRVK